MEDALRRFLFMFELTGLQYFSLEHDNLEDPPTALRRNFMIVLIILTTLLVSSFLMFVPVEAEIVTAKNMLNFAIRHSMSVSVVLVVYTSFIQSYTSTRKIKKVFLNNKELVRVCQRDFGMPVDFRHIQRTARKRFFVMTVFLAAAHTVLGLFMVQNLQYVLGLIILFFPYFFLFLIVYKFVFYVGMVNEQLMSLKSLLEGLFTHNQASKKSVNRFSFASWEQHSRSSELLKNLKSEELLRKLRASRKIYNLVFDNSTLINESLGLTVLILLICLVIVLTATGFEIFITVVGKSSKLDTYGKRVVFRI